eukprot:gnl/TRDRNA2_/TRDRNA2_128742_c1_seq1.p1 gnl/TRDRNA2_/TRDRNA2_128742_c1~~gnl/TRDRNA2_/TRDRNA2_128742_c1_seq1.p1  ORF type:complete len:242 (+),score=20.90 gnl/TRDRNA2_/TRDRNA2_128742_c1_seq1:213-938(+)
MGEKPCSYSVQEGKSHRQIDPCLVESASRRLVKRWLPTDASVLEIGAGYGTTSCEISAVLRNSGFLVVAEPDRFKSAPLMENRISHCCRFHIWPGTVGSKRPAEMPISELPPTGMLKARNLTFFQVEAEYGMRFDVLVINCDGCVEKLLSENTGVLQNIKLILLTADLGTYLTYTAPGVKRPIDYNKLLERLQKDEGFEILQTLKSCDVPSPKRGKDRQCKEWVHYFALKRNSSINIRRPE